MQFEGRFIRLSNFLMKNQKLIGIQYDKSKQKKE